MVFPSTVRTVPEEGAPSGWYELLPPPLPARRWTGRGRVDCAIVGAGFTGLAAASRLAALRPQWRIVVLEAQRVGLGASGRNSGFVVHFANNSAWKDAATRRRAVEINRAGLEQLRAWAQAWKLGADWNEDGWLHAMSDERSRPSLDGLKRQLDAAEEPYASYEADDLRRMLGTEHYVAALRIAGGAVAQPAQLVRSMAAHLAGEVEVYEESPVLKVTAGRTVRLAVAEGEVEAERLLIAVNGFAPAFGVLRQRTFPLLTFAALTRPLTPREQEVLGGDPEWGLIDLEPLGASVRRTRDHRILIRSLYAYSRDARLAAEHFAVAKQVHRQAFAKRFPQLAGVEFVHRWSGVLGITRNRLPCFGKLDNNVFTAAGYSGAGIAMGVGVGQLLADLAVGEESALLRDMLALPRPGWLPPEPFFTPIARHHLRRLAASAVIKH